MRKLWFVFAALLLTAVAARAQDYPQRPIHMIIAFGPGGGSDTVICTGSLRIADSKTVGDGSVQAAAGDSSTRQSASVCTAESSRTSDGPAVFCPWM